MDAKCPDSSESSLSLSSIPIIHKTSRLFLKMHFLYSCIHSRRLESQLVELEISYLRQVIMIYYSNDRWPAERKLKEISGIPIDKHISITKSKF